MNRPSRAGFVLPAPFSSLGSPAAAPIAELVQVAYPRRQVETEASTGALLPRDYSGQKPAVGVWEESGK